MGHQQITCHFLNYIGWSILYGKTDQHLSCESFCHFVFAAGIPNMGRCGPKVIHKLTPQNRLLEAFCPEPGQPNLTCFLHASTSTQGQILSPGGAILSRFRIRNAFFEATREAYGCASSGIPDRQLFLAIIGGDYIWQLAICL